MSRQTTHVPAYRLHKPSGQARVIIQGRHVYLGSYGSPESREKYARVIAELATDHGSNGHSSSSTRCSAAILINELILAYWQFAKRYYVKDGEPTKELTCMREALLPLRQLYGSTPADQFGPKSLAAVRQQMVDSGLSRGVVNRRIGRIKRVFKWAVAEELIPPSAHHGLQTVVGLRYGRTEARETEPIKPVPNEHVDAVLPFLPPQISAMIQLQRYTGMRPGEVVKMRACDIDMSGEVWIYERAEHKNRWRGHRRLIPLGPRAQAEIKPFLDRDPQQYMFSPLEAEAWRLERRPVHQKENRKTPIYPSELKAREEAKLARRKRKSKRPRKACYDTDSYRRAITYGIVKAGKASVKIPSWHPNQLRHNRGTEIRKEFGIEAAQVVLGHARADVTEVYAEKNLALAMKIAKELG